MGRRTRGSGRKAPSKLWRSFFVLVSGIVGCYILIASVVVFAFIRTADGSEVVAKDYTKENAPAIQQEEDKNPTFKTKYLVPPKITTVLVVGTDKTNLLTDVVILGFFNRETGDVDLISVPRDLYVTLPEDLEKEIKDAGKYIPSAMKITELHSYAGADMGDYALKEKLNQEFNLSIDYTANVSLESFRQIVDIVGPITMEIPEGGLHYYDPDQNLRIDVPGGVQQLDGEMAEGVVRYRATYQRGDLQRIEVQQEFMRQLFSQALNKETLMNNATAILSTILEYVTTDFKAIEAPKYIPYIAKLSPSKFETHTLPGEPAYMSNGEQNISYFVHDPLACKELFDGIIFATDTAEEIMEVGVYNGGVSDVRFKEIISELEADGYVVFEAEGYEGDSSEESKIIINSDEAKAEFDKYFNKLTKLEGGNLPADFDAVIIVGSGE
ncbi:LCP family protein [Tyzzerella sp. OttesenSCG-928-J15]|nr:LCP family protein [Tyzzerella sp. OttesenSCG-928-J15]